MKKIIIDIDVSKEKPDFCVQSPEKILHEFIVENTTRAVKSTLKKVLKTYPIMTEDMLLCAEHTGRYTYPQACVYEELSVDLCLENSAQIKHSSGVVRGKNDRADARKIAAYAFRFQDKARLFSLPEKNIASLKQFISERDMYLSEKSKYQGQITDRKQVG